MLHIEVAVGDDEQRTELAHVLVWNVTDDAEDEDGLAAYDWAAIQTGTTKRATPVAVGHVERHPRAAGWAPLAAAVLSSLAEALASGRVGGPDTERPSTPEKAHLGDQRDLPAGVRQVPGGGQHHE